MDFDIKFLARWSLSGRILIVNPKLKRLYVYALSEHAALMKSLYVKQIQATRLDLVEERNDDL